MSNAYHILLVCMCVGAGCSSAARGVCRQPGSHRSVETAARCDRCQLPSADERRRQPGRVGNAELRAVGGVDGRGKGSTGALQLPARALPHGRRRACCAGHGLAAVVVGGGSVTEQESDEIHKPPPIPCLEPLCVLACAKAFVSVMMQQMHTTACVHVGKAVGGVSVYFCNCARHRRAWCGNCARSN